MDRPHEGVKNVLSRRSRMWEDPSASYFLTIMILQQTLKGTVKWLRDELTIIHSLPYNSPISLHTI